MLQGWEGNQDSLSWKKTKRICHKQNYLKIGYTKFLKQKAVMKEGNLNIRRKKEDSKGKYR